jgi:hypothetical protein
VRIELPQHTIWCRNADFTPDFVEILLNEGDETHFRFRRDPSIRLPRAKAFISTGAGVTLLAPEIVLLYKSNNLEHAGNVADFAHALPHLNARQRDWLAAALMQLYGEHPWLDGLTEQTDRIILP